MSYRDAYTTRQHPLTSKIHPAENDRNAFHLCFARSAKTSVSGSLRPILFLIQTLLKPFQQLQDIKAAVIVVGDPMFP